MFQHTSRRAISLALLLVSSITFQSFAFTGVVRAQKLKPLRAPVAKPKTGGAGGAVPTPNAPNLAGATKVDSWDDTATPDGKAEPGQTITYNVTITNSGPDPATGVTFTDTIDPNTTLVAGSVQTQPIATNDTATAFGNVRISTANGAVNLLANDCDPDDTTGPCNDNLTASGPATSTNNGNVVVNADGTFSYDPFPGFTGTDTFTYTIRDKGPDNIANNADDKTDTAVMTITVGPTLIWFIDNTAAGGGNGRLTSPFNSIAAFNAGAADDPGDIIFLFNGTGTYTGAFTLLNTQKLIGQGFALATETGAAPAGSDALPAAGSTPTIDNTGANIITLGLSNTLRGFNTGNSGSAGTDITGTSFGTLTVSNLSVNGDGRALNLTTGTLSATISNILASNTGANAGLVLNAVGGTLTVSGNTTITNPGGNGIDISNGPAATTYSLGTASISKNAAGACLNLASNNAGTTTGFTSLTITNSSGAGITTNNGGTLNATTGSITTTGTGVAASFTNTVLGLTFTTVSSNGGANGLIFSGGSGSFTSGTTNLQNNAGIGLLMSSSAVVAGFGNTTVNSSAGDAIDLSSNTGNITFADCDLTPDAGLRGLDAQNNTGTITVTSGDITTSGGTTASAVFIDGPAGRTPINLTFTSVTTSGVGSGSPSINLVDVSGTKFQVTGTTQINTRSGTGVLVNNSTATNIQLGTTNVPNPSNAGGYGIRVESSSSAVTVSTATIDNANVVTAQTDAGDGTPGNDGDGDAIFLKSNTGSFALNGGTLSNCGNDCLDVRDSKDLTVSGVTVQSPGIDTPGTGTGQGGNGFQLINLTGTNSVTGTTFNPFTAAGHAGIYFFNKGGGTSTTTVQGVTFSGFTGNGSVGVDVITQGSSTTNFTIGGPTNNVATNCTFTNVDGSAINYSTSGTGTLNATLQRSTFQNAATDSKTNVTGGNSGTSDASYNILNNTFNNVMLTASTGEGLLSFSADGTVSGNSFAMNMTGNTISNVGSSATNCGGGATACLGPINAILIFIDDAASVPGTIIVDSNIITNTQQGGILLDMHNTGVGSSAVAAKIINNTVGTDALPVGVNNSPTVSYGIRVEKRANNASSSNVLINNNSIRNGSAVCGGCATSLNGAGIHLRTKANDSMSVTVTNNNVSTLTAGHSEMRFDTNANDVGDIISPTMCVDANGNTLAGGAAGLITLFEINGALNIEQASAAALSAANGGATVTTSSGTPQFGITCATPPAAPATIGSNMVNALPTNSSTVAAEIATTNFAPAVAEMLAYGVHTSTMQTLVNLALDSQRAVTNAPAQAERESSTTVATTPARSTGDNSRAQQKEVKANHARNARNTERASGTATVTHAAPPAPLNGETVSVNIGTLAPGDSVTITFQVVIDNPYSGGPNVSNQGTVSGGNFSNVLTDDPAVGGAADPTLTPINSTNILLNDAKQAEPGSGTAQMLFTVTLSQPAGAGGLSVNYATANGGGTPATGGASCSGAEDYITASGTATVPAGSKTTTIPVTICADANVEGDETLLMNISSPSSGNILDNQATGTITANTPGTFLISELRTSGPGGLGDDFVELYNNTNSPLTVAASDASAGYGLYKVGADCNASPVLIGTIPNGTVIPARGHYLVVGSQYSLANYGGAGAAAGNLTMTSDIESDRNVAVFSTANVDNISSANRLDAVGFGGNTGPVCDLLREGTNLGAVSGSTAEHAFFRKECDFVSGVGCVAGGNPKDTNDNSADFLFADTQGTFISGVPQHLGAPGPENLASPIRRDTSGIGMLVLDTTVASSAHPNRTRSFTSDPANNSTFGTLTVRRRVINSTGGNVTRLRYRIVEMTTFPSPGGGVADLRVRTSVDEVGLGPVNDAATCTASGAGSPPCTVTVRGTTLETPPAQPNGGGYNSTLSQGTVTLGTPLANGASVNVKFLLGIQTTGSFRFYIIIEALP